MYAWMRNLIRLSWVEKSPGTNTRCGFCNGSGRTHIDGTPALIGEINPNIGTCGNCAGSGLIFGNR